MLKDVAYVIEAHAVLTPKAGADETVTKHIEMFKRRVKKGNVFSSLVWACVNSLPILL